MSPALGTVADLPSDYYNGLVGHNLLPLWPSLRAVLPYGKPTRKTKAVLWKYADIRPNLLRAGELAPIEKAERRVLVLCNPGLGLENMQATPSIYIGLQLILPGETAPNHRHSPMAVRFVIEGKGGYTVVQGEKLPMDKGDLILTPPKLWHQHGHEGSEPVIWLDALDLPVVYGLEASYAIEGALQTITDPHNAGTTRFRQGGIVPYASLAPKRSDYPLLRFPWRDVRQTLTELAALTPRGQAVHVAYVNPETGQECMASLGFSALMLRPGEELRLPKRSASAVLHGVEGGGTATVDGTAFAFGESDTIAVPTHAEVVLGNASAKAPAFLFMVDDAPLHRKLGFYEVFE
jgi:gentisate 1,2-dioxygenase